MKRKPHLVLHHLEDISWRIMEEYSQLIREMIRGRSGVYALYRKSKLYYVGLASNLMGRLKAHLRDHHHGAWDRFSVYLTSRDDQMKDLESLVLRMVKPVGNKVKGKLTDATSLRGRLNQQMRDHDADRRAMFLGGQVARRRRKAKTRKTKGTRILSGLVERRIALRGRLHGRTFKASLHKDGTIRFGKKLYASPTAAGKKAIGRNTNGWWFWKYRNSEGEWVRLRNLRK